jgi:hypothetical protein
MSIGSPYRAASEDAGMSTLRVLADIIRGDGGKVKRNTGTISNQVVSVLCVSLTNMAGVLIVAG